MKSQGGVPMTGTALFNDKFKTLSEHEIFLASEWYKQSFHNKISEMNFYKILGRFTEENKLSKITKGLYFVPKKGKYGLIPVMEHQIITKFIPTPNDGMEIGFGLFNRLGLSTQIAKTRTLLTRRMDADHRFILNLIFIKKDLIYSEPVKKIIEFLEILQSFSAIQDLNRTAFFKITKNFARTFCEDSLWEVLSVMKYKKSTLAFLAQILDHHGIVHRVHDRLSVLSKYNIPKWMFHYEVA